MIRADYVLLLSSYLKNSFSNVEMGIRKYERENCRDTNLAVISAEVHHLLNSQSIFFHYRVGPQAFLQGRTENLTTIVAVSFYHIAHNFKALMKF